MAIKKKIMFFILLIIITFLIGYNLNKQQDYIIGNGNSMQPTFYHNDTLFVEKVTDIKLNEIYSYKNKKGENIVHRLIAINGNELTFKGDNNSFNDTVVNSYQLEYHIIIWGINKNVKNK